MSSEGGSAIDPHDVLPEWTSVLAVVAHPDDESFGLGAILDTFARSGAAVWVLCLTHGEASTISGSDSDLRTVRAAELRRAAQVLGVSSAILRDYPDGALDTVDVPTLLAEVAETVGLSGAQGLVVFDPSGVTGHPDHAAASAVALEAAAVLDLPVLGWTLPQAVAEQLNTEFDAKFSGHLRTDIDLMISVDRDPQRMASLAHASQAVPTSVLWRRLEILGGREYLRWLRRTDRPTHSSERRRHDDDGSERPRPRVSRTPSATARPISLSKE